MTLLFLIAVIGIVSTAVGHSLGWDAGWEARDSLGKK